MSNVKKKAILLLIL